MSMTIDRMLTRVWLGLATSLALAGSLHLGAVVGSRPWLSLPVQAGPASPGPRCDPADAPVVHRDAREEWNPARARP